MIKGVFSFLLFIFSSPQDAITNKLEGYWLVVEDNTESFRKHWNRVIVFEKCDKEFVKSMTCNAYFGWVDQLDLFTNLLDRNYTKYGVERKKDAKKSGRKLKLGDQYFDFILNLNNKTLELSDPDTGKKLMVMDKQKPSWE